MLPILHVQAHCVDESVFRMGGLVLADITEPFEETYKVVIAIDGVPPQAFSQGKSIGRSEKAKCQRSPSELRPHH